MSFNDVTDKYIEDKELRRQGGYLGVQRRQDLRPEISAAVFATKPPQLLKPIVKAKGISLILVEEIIQPELDDQLRYQIVSELFGEWIINQIESVSVVTNLG
ncbi:MAG: peptidylprolyl isomerase [Microcystis aeruginosa W13-18]|jgi:parvulin-like peptidyl-prolyl isomerase|nr:peptidylprolyl isomerase [Microcystis aeruginosa W13-18]NCR34469.1 peptidylprolyl isomerase [Microcystis aeruginosa S11-05]NCR47927.1 peptidylprolyl isomerase [Microcystis aeruginosa S11-01]